MGFRELDHIKGGYDSGFDRILQDFYIPVLNEAKVYKRIAGFFSSTSLAIAARGITGLIKNGGYMELIVSPRLSDEDIKAMEKAAQDPEEIITSVMLDEIENMETFLQKKRVDALGWLLAKGLLKIKVATVYDDKGKMLDYEKVEETGLFHIKVGILEDENGDIITFSGSINETASAWVRNVEEFKVFKYWEPGQTESAKIDIEKFEKYWFGESARVKIMDLPSAVEKKIIKETPRSIEKIEQDLLEAEIKENENAINLNFSPFSYQLEALEIWKKNHRAIFEMATGTGKTKTAQVCIADFIKKCDVPAVVFIICPQDTLAKQWLRDIQDSGIPADNYVICDSDSRGWNKDGENSLLYKLLDVNVERAGKKSILFVYSTFDTYYSEYFVNTVQQYKFKAKYLIIGDEVHGLGSSQRAKGFLEDYEYRLGLSATPDRWFDEHGTQVITDFFGSDRYYFTIEEALTRKNPLTGKTYLTPYEYIPRFVSLEIDELMRYKQLSNSIIRGLCKAKTDGEYADRLQNLMFMRADIHKSAVNKMKEFENILDEIGDDINDTIIFTSAGQIDDVEQILKRRGIFTRRFTKDQGKAPEKKYGNMSEREHIIQMFKDGDCQCLLAIKCLDEGIDIPSAKRAIILASSTNPREYVQRIGRIIRRYEGKEKAVLYDIIVEPSLEQMEQELAKFEKKIFEKEMVRISEISENAMNRLEIINEVYDRLL